MADDNKRAIIKALPNTVQEFRDQRQVAEKLTLNDYVEEIHLMLYEVKEYKLLIDATTDEDAEEGTRAADNHMAALMIREKAKSVRLDHPAAVRPDGRKRTVAAIAKALNVVMSRYGLGRNQRRTMIGGVVVNDSSNNDQAA